MKAAIITFYDAYNYGAFWQAKCLKDFINNIEDVECEILKVELRKDCLRTLKQFYYFFSRKISFQKMRYEIERYRYFQKFSEKLNPQFMHNIYDVYIFGSDELWNIKKKKNRRNRARILWGMGLSDSSRKISYAPSVNESNEKDFDKLPSFKENVSKFNSLSARDQKSVDVLENVLGRNVKLVLDPTLLQKPEYFNNYQVMESEIERNEYLLLYVYKRLITEKEINLIKSFSKEKKLKIISLGDYLNFADESILCTPEQFLTYYKNASYVFTNTFHGVMFSIVFRKNFGILDSHQLKVEEAISQFGLGKLRVSDLDNTWNLDNRDMTKIWDDVYETIEKYRIESENYLVEAINATD